MQQDRNAARLAGDAERDPVAVDWSIVSLPDAWPDELDLRRPAHLVAYVRGWLGARRKVVVPADLPGGDRLPAYLRQEFHHLPNGVYSKRHADSYARWFDRLMLGDTVRARARLAAELAGCRATLDVGCGSGGLAAAMRAAGVPEVWGLDPSPYLLQLAARAHRGIRFVQGLAERTGFPAQRFEGIGACFLFHELPPRAADAALVELHRILVPGGRLVIAEPSPTQFRVRAWRALARREGRRGLYFAAMAKWMYEPFVAGWHGRAVASWLAAHGFRVLGDERGVPIRFVSAVRDEARSSVDHG
ncbi:MAG: class I SAM-dependent methyltransferase [Deltaproteobacteria bacterium]|nr:class I SAM-dependent methyltransferase [Deltaproteobacteria bacterium]